jgi:UDP-2,3-diacylglucosamine hydrolase
MDNMAADQKTLGILAGKGRLPIIAADNARRMGYRVVVSILKETGARWPKRNHARAETISIGQAAKTLSFFENESVDEVLLIGKVDKRLNFADIEFDEVAQSMLARLFGRSDMNIAAVLIEEFEQRGFRVAPQTDFLGDALAPEGQIVGALDDALMSDVEKGREIVRDLAKHDIGQTVILRQGAVIAVEAFEHTDATIRRAGRLSGGGFAVVKCSRPHQDMRFDVPAVGVSTLRSIAAAGGRALALEAGRVMLIDRDRFMREAEILGICVVGLK